MTAIIVIVPWVATSGEHVSSVNVIDVAVSIVVPAGRSVQFGFVDPQVVDQIGVSVINAGVKDCNNRIAASGGVIPGFEGVYARPRSLVVYLGVIRSDVKFHLDVFRNGAHGRILTQGFTQLVEIPTCRHVKQHDVEP